jgi:hypothetical protein
MIMKYPLIIAIMLIYAQTSFTMNDEATLLCHETLDMNDQSNRPTWNHMMNIENNYALPLLPEMPPLSELTLNITADEMLDQYIKHLKAAVPAPTMHNNNNKNDNDDHDDDNNTPTHNSNITIANPQALPQAAALAITHRHRCNLCPRAFARLRGLINHQRSHPRDAPNRQPYVCDQPGCNYDYKYKRGLDEHLLKHHGIIVTSTQKWHQYVQNYLGQSHYLMKRRQVTSNQ